MPVFGPAQKAKLSFHARHLANSLEASRDHVRMSAAVFGAAVVYASHALAKGDGPFVVGVGAAVAVGAGYAAIKLYQHTRQMDQKIDHLARETGQDEPLRNRFGMVELSASQHVVANADPLRPDMVKAIANRRERRWDAALDPNYRPPQRIPRSGG